MSNSRRRFWFNHIVAKSLRHPEIVENNSWIKRNCMFIEILINILKFGLCWRIIRRFFGLRGIRSNEGKIRMWANIPNLTEVERSLQHYQSNVDDSNTWLIVVLHDVVSSFRLLSIIILVMPVWHEFSRVEPWQEKRFEAWSLCTWGSFSFCSRIILIFIEQSCKSTSANQHLMSCLAFMCKNHVITEGTSLRILHINLITHICQDFLHV
jgi:hypothetical protein